MTDAPVAPDALPARPTPVERAVLPDGAAVWLKRDDAYRVAGAIGGKARTCWHLATAGGVPTGLVTAGSRQSPQVGIVARIARRLGVPCRVHVPAAAGPLTPELAAAQAAGAAVVGHRPGHNSVIVARAREDARSRGWREIPFGMECREAVRQTAGQAAALAAAPPDGLRRIVVPVGSGMSLAGILAGLARAGCAVPVVGVVVGADPAKRLDAYAPPGWRQRVTLVRSPLDYHAPAATTVLDGVRLDPIYEAKCLPYLRAGDLLWIVGIRPTRAPQAAGSAAPPAPTGGPRGAGLRWPVPDEPGWPVAVVPADGDAAAAAFAAAVARRYKAELGYIPTGAYRDTGPDKPARLYLAQTRDAARRPVGFLYAVRRKREPALKIDRVARLPDAPPGTGRALFEQALRLAAGYGLPRIVLEVRRGNSRAIGFYRHMGMATTGTKGENLLMALELPPAAPVAPAAAGGASRAGIAAGQRGTAADGDLHQPAPLAG